MTNALDHTDSEQATQSCQLRHFSLSLSLAQSVNVARLSSRQATRTLARFGLPSPSASSSSTPLDKKAILSLVSLYVSTFKHTHFNTLILFVVVVVHGDLVFHLSSLSFSLSNHCLLFQIERLGWQLRMYVCAFLGLPGRAPSSSSSSSVAAAFICLGRFLAKRTIKQASKPASERANDFMLLPFMYD